MKSIIAAVVTCVILFGASFAASKYYMESEAAVEAGDETTPKEDSVDQSSTLPPNESVINKVDQMPVSHRPEKSVSLEAVLQMSDSIKKMEEKLRLRELKLEREEQRVNLLFVDLETEQDQLQAFSEGLDKKVESLSRMTTELKDLLASLDEKKAELATLEKAAGVDDESKLTELDNKANNLKSWFEGLAAPQASDYLREFANTGKLELAASLLHKMPNRQKAKILAEMSDPALVDQLIGALKVKPKTK